MTLFITARSGRADRVAHAGHAPTSGSSRLRAPAVLSTVTTPAGQQTEGPNPARLIGSFLPGSFAWSPPPGSVAITRDTEEATMFKEPTCNARS